MTGWIDDLRFAARSLRKRPGLTLAVVATLGLGLGINVALFSAADAALWAPLPFPGGDRLVSVQGRETDTGRRTSVSYPDFLDWSRQIDGLTVAAWSSGGFTFGGDTAAAERVQGEWASAEYLPVLGIEPRLGRGFTASDEAAPGASPVVVLAHDLWQRRFAGNPGVIGTEVPIQGRTFTVIGVMPAGFRGLSGEAELWVPFSMFEALNPELTGYDILGSRGIRWHSAVGRLAAGVGVTGAEQRLAAVAARLRELHPESNQHAGVHLVPLRQELAGDLKPAFAVLLATAGAVLLIACVNLVHLLLARAVGRRRELLVRAALGAGRGRLFRQFLGEGVLLAVAGGLTGVLLAAWGLDLLLRLLPLSLPAALAPTVDGRVLAFAAVAALVAGLATGTLPAAMAARVRPAHPLTAAPASRGGDAPRRLFALLMAGEVALSLVLVVGAALMLASLGELTRFDPGFEPRGLLTLRFDLPAGATADDPSPLRAPLLDAVAATPGVARAAYTSHLYFAGGYMSRDVVPEGRGEEAERPVIYQFVGSGYFATLGVPILSGRDFRPSDDAGAPLVAAVARAFADAAWPGEDPLGKRVKLGGAGSDRPSAEVVAVVGDVTPRLGGGEGRDQIYLPLGQGGQWGRAMVVRAQPGLPPETLVPALRRAAARVSPAIALYDAASMHHNLRSAGGRTRSLSILLASFAALALALAALGIYGVTAFAAARRVHEIGVRMALGARRRQITALFLARGAVDAGLGVAAGLGAALLLAGSLSSLLYRVEPYRPLPFAAAALVAAAAALAGTWLPARRAARRDPARVLHRE